MTKLKQISEGGKMTSKTKTIEVSYNKIIGLEHTLSRFDPRQDKTNRGIGTSTGQALAFIGILMQNPRGDFQVPKDHLNNTERMQIQLAYLIEATIAKLGLIGFERTSRISFKYNPIGTATLLVHYD